MTASSVSKNALRRLDLVFCIDLTGSMGQLIKAARENVGRILDGLTAALENDLRVGMVGYRDHSDGPKLLEIVPLSTDTRALRSALDAVKVDGGGDAPEAVFAGLLACLEQAWAQGSYRMVILIGDAPPHSVGAAGDRYPNDPTGMSVDDVANKLEAEGLFVHALSLTPNDKVLEAAFKRLSISTGGTYADATNAEAAMRLVESVTQRFVADLDFDRRLLELVPTIKAPPPRDDEATPSKNDLLAKALNVPLESVWAGMMRLRRRRLLDGLED